MCRLPADEKCVVCQQIMDRGEQSGQLTNLFIGLKMLDLNVCVSL